MSQNLRFGARTGTALALLLSSVSIAAPVWAQTDAVNSSVEGCALVNGVIPPHCAQPGAGTVVVVSQSQSELDAGDAPTGDLGFSIVLDAVAPQDERIQVAGDDAPTAPRPERLRGTATHARQMDRIMAAAGVQISFDGLTPQTRLAVSTMDTRRTYVAGQGVTFRASSNYPAWIARAEVQIVDADRPSRVIARLPIAANGTADWTMPAGGPDEMAYRLRVYDADGRYDETFLLPIARTATEAEAEEQTGTGTQPGQGDDMSRRRTIPVSGGAVTIQAQNVVEGTQVQVFGETITAPGGPMVLERILPPGTHDVRVGAGPQGVQRVVNVPASDWFYVGLADLTWSQRRSGSETRGRVAGFVRGQTADGVRVTAAVETGDRPIEDLFRDVGRRDPHEQLRMIEADDVYPTFGDDSTIEELAPTSGGLYLEVEHNGGRSMWGDFHADPITSPLVRSDRTLYGLRTEYTSPSVTERGEPVVQFGAYASQPDRLVQRDRLEATGGSAFFLTRREILPETERVYIVLRDRVSDRIIARTQIERRRDYTINYFEGLVLLNRPLSTLARDGRLGIDSLSSDTRVELAVNYEYRPRAGSIDGESVGAGGQVWLSDTVRVGAAAQRESTGVADNEIVGADIAWVPTETTSVTLAYAESEGPGFGGSSSGNGGLDIIDDPTRGVTGQRASALQAEADIDLADLGGEGTMRIWYDRLEAGFVSADHNIASTQTDYGVEGNVTLSERARIVFRFRNFENEAGRTRRDYALGGEFDLTEALTLAAEYSQTERADPLAAANQTGSRQDLAVRLTYAPDEDRALWVFARRTLAQQGGLTADHRAGIGGRYRFSDALTGEMELSDGTLGPGGMARLAWTNNAGTEVYFGYELDPERAYNRVGFVGENRGRFILGGAAQINDNLRYRNEHSLDLFGRERSQTQSHGLTYTPTDRWSYEFGFTNGRSWQTDGSILHRRGLNAAVRYANGEDFRAGLSGDIHREENSQDPSVGRTSFGLRGRVESRLHDDWRLLSSLDAVVSRSDQAQTRDGHFVEANLGFAYRPVNNERFNMFFRFTALSDQPGQDQVNVDGSTSGPGQRSAILSANMHYDLTQTWSLSGKYGYRMRQIVARDGTLSGVNTSHLLALRADYHLVHNWDISGELRAMYHERTSTREDGALFGVWRHIGGHARLGLGYQWGRVSDDMRTIQGSDEGVFVNITAQF